jgi:HSP20 family protein
MNTFFDDFLSKDLMEMTGPNFATLGTNLPSVNLKRQTKKLKSISSSWSKKEDFKIELDNKMLTISSEKEQEKRRKGITRIIIEKSLVINHSQIFNLPITRMKTKSMLIIKMAYCMLLLPKEGERLLPLNKEDLL